MRVLLFTDTLVDVNGVSRFITNLRDYSISVGRDLTVVCSTTRPLALNRATINLRPALSVAMPGYPELELVFPERGGAMATALKLQPDVIHVSTPGPVGLAGRRVAQRLGVPLAGVYHTDFARYAKDLFADEAMTFAMEHSLRWIYRPFDRIIARSSVYVDELESAGMARAQLRTLEAGVDSVRFSPAHRDQAALHAMVGRAVPGVRVLYCGRVSVEKNLQLLMKVWPAVAAAARTHGVNATLLVVGHGPLLEEMRHALRGHDAVFLGFRTGAELSMLYATSDFLVFPSLTDTLGQAVLEAQASGLPVLVSDRGGPRTSIVDGVTGQVLSSVSHHPWHKAMLALIVDDERRRAMSAAAVRHARELTIERSLEHWWALHEELLEEHAGLTGHVPTMQPPHA